MARIKIVSWNIWGGKNLKEIIDCLRVLDADVVALQEVLADEDGANNIAEAIAEALDYEWEFVNTRTLDPSLSFLLQEQKIDCNKQWGNAILSKYPMGESSHYFLSEKSPRMALEAVIEIEDKKLRVFSTHLAHAPHLSEIRVAQAESLLKLISDEPTIVAGDFNDVPESETIQRMDAVLNRGKNVSATNDNKRIDYIFATKDVQIVEDGMVDSQASDHFPLYAIVEI